MTDNLNPEPESPFGQMFTDTETRLADLPADQQETARKIEATLAGLLVPVKHPRLKEKVLRTGMLRAKARLEGLPPETAFAQAGTLSKPLYARKPVLRTATAQVEAYFYGMGIQFAMSKAAGQQASQFTN